MIQIETISLTFWNDIHQIPVFYESWKDQEMSQPQKRIYQKFQTTLSSIVTQFTVALEQYYFNTANYSWAKELFNHINHYIHLDYIEIVGESEVGMRFYFSCIFDQGYHICVTMDDKTIKHVERDRYKILEEVKRCEEKKSKSLEKKN